MSHKICHIVWRDASHSASDTKIEDAGIVELRTVGFLVKENDQEVVLAMEDLEVDVEMRFWLAIPKTGIVSRIDRAFPKPSKPRTRKAPHVPNGPDHP